MNCQIISIGDELLLGDTVNTNATWLGEALTRQGVRVTRVHTIGDDKAAIQNSIRQALDESDLVITTGGLGPTHDDITKTAVAELFDAELIIHPPTLEYIKEMFKRRNLPFSSSNYHQAEVPENCKVLFNKGGTAPGMWFEAAGSHLAVLPGIPQEMKGLFNEQLLPRIDGFRNGGEYVHSFYIKFAGVGESTLSDEMIGPLDAFTSDELSVAYLPSPEANTLRINVQAANKQEATHKAKPLQNYIYRRAGSAVLGEGRDLTVSKALGVSLRRQGLTVSVAESCTGGLLASTLTDTPGSSEYVLGGIVAYANQVKITQLGIADSDLEQYGAVSKPVALSMAKGVATRMKSDIGISTTGIAGPGGGTDLKPVGTVWIGFWSADAHFALTTELTDDRQMNKRRTVTIAMDMVRRIINGIETMPYGLKPQTA